MANAIDLNKKTFFVVTGASRGIGKQMAIECSKKFKSDSVVLLLARSEIGLKETKAEIIAANPSITVDYHIVNLCNISSDELRKYLTKSLDQRKVEEFELAFIIHNVGTIGDISKFARELDDTALWSDYFNLNVFTVAQFNSIFINIFKVNQKFIVNITSKAATDPFHATALYASGKAAREIYFRTLALEDPEILVLNYSPGPVDTEMTIELQCKSAAKEMREMMQGLRETKTILTTAETTKKFLEVVSKGAYKTGAHVDYYD